MAKRRTKAQKIKTQARQHSLEIKFKPENIAKKSKKKKIVEVEDKIDKKLIIRDLIKTVVISLVLLGLLIGAYFYLN